MSKRFGGLGRVKGNSDDDAPGDWLLWEAVTLGLRRKGRELVQSLASATASGQRRELPNRSYGCSSSPTTARQGSQAIKTHPSPPVQSG